MIVLVTWGGCRLSLLAPFQAAWRRIEPVLPQYLVKWLVPPCPPRIHGVGVQTDREVMKELREEGTDAEQYRAQCWCYQGLPYCHLGTCRYFSCMAQEGGESIHQIQMQMG